MRARIEEHCRQVLRRTQTQVCDDASKPIGKHRGLYEEAGRAGAKGSHNGVDCQLLRGQGVWAVDDQTSLACTCFEAGPSFDERPAANGAGQVRDPAVAPCAPRKRSAISCIGSR